MNITELFSKNLKRLRTERRMTQAELAEKLGVSGVSVFGYESGSQFPRSDVLNSLCVILRIRPWQLLAETGENEQLPPEVVDLAGQLARACGLKVNGRG